MKRILSLLLSVLMFMSVCTLLPAVSTADDGLIDADLDYTESTAILKNPNMGYPSHAAMTLTDTMSARNDSGFMWYYININNYSGSNSLLSESIKWPEGRVDRPISDHALNAFRKTLDNLRENGGSCFIRFVYDWDGKPGYEPSELNTILTHIKQLCDVVSDFADICFGFECGTIGVFGEMHSSIYCGAEYANPIIDTYLKNTPDTMVLMVRTPAYICNYLGVSRTELVELVTEKGSPEYRLSYFNDGYMNSGNDLGTWASREQDLKFLSRQAAHGAYGGEFGSAYWMLPCNACLPENAIPEMYQTHLNFIRGNVYKITDSNPYFGYDTYEYGPEYEKEWYPDNSAFYGENCHQFIVAHLGYRLVLRESRLTAEPKAGGKLTLKGKIENTGFGNIFTEPTTQILLVGDGYSYVCDTAIKAETFQSCTVQDYSTTLNLPASMPAGEYKVYMRMTASTQTDFLSVKSAIQFANNGGIFSATLGGNLIGTINVDAGEKSASAANDVFCEVGAGAISGGRVTHGAPVLSGYGMNVPTEAIDMNYHQGETLTLSAWNMFRSDAKVTYKWYKGSNQVGDKATLVIDDLTKADAGEYKLTVSSGSSKQTTVTVNVTVDDHKFGDYTTVKVAGCHTVGSERRTCTHCSLTEFRVTPTTAHTAGKAQKTESTCTVRGNITTKCAKCAEVLDYKVLSLVPHDCETIIEEPTCLRDGKSTLDCIDCDYEQSEPIEALGHNYIYAVNGNKAVGTCSRCMEKTEEITFNGFTDGHVVQGDFDNDLGPVDANKAPLTFIGEGGYLNEYDANGAGLITFLFRAEGVETPMKLGKFRTLGYAQDDKNNLGDSNNAGNYYGDLLYKVDGDGVYAITFRKFLMLPFGNNGWGLITQAGFNDPDMNKGKETENENEDATVELIGVYNNYVDYHLLYTDGNDGFLQSASGTYNPNITWGNKMERVYTVDELYTGEVPTKRATKDKTYTFSHWETVDGEAIELAVGKYVLVPVFTESENTCEHKNTEKGVILAPTCTEKGKGADTCTDCGAPVGEIYSIDVTGHQNETKSVKVRATFKEAGEYNVYCSDCRTFLRAEVIPALKNPFKDVKVNGWYSDAVAYAYDNSIFGGTSATTFAPDANMTRAMFVTVLGRMSGVEENKDATTVFTDVKKGQYYTGYVAWANKNGIVNGRTANTFAPNELITREEMCVMLVRYCEYELITLKTNPVVDSFADVTKFSKWSINQIETCRRTGLVGGKAVNANGGALFVPKGNATRAEVATILYNLRTKHIDG